MQQILAITRKEIRLWLKKPGSWIIVFIMPFVFILIMQAVFGSSGTPVVTVFAVNEENSLEAQRAMQALRSASNLKIDELKTREEADQRVGTGEYMAAVIIPRYFSRDIASPEGASIEIIIDPARAEQASIVTGLVNAALAPMIVDAEVNRGVEASVSKIMESVQSGGQTSRPGSSINTKTLQQFFTAAVKGVVSSQVQQAIDDPQVQLDAQPLLENGSNTSRNSDTNRRPTLLDFLVPGYSLMFVYFLIANLAVTVIEERQTGTLRRLLVAPVPRSRILLGKMLPFFLIAVIQFVTVLLVSKLAFGIDLGNSALALGIVILASSLAMVALGILVAAFARTEGQADGLSIVLVLAMAVVSGAMFPNISVPGIQAITPHYWSMQGFLNIIARGQGVQSVMLPAGILLTMAALFFAIGAIRFRFE